MEAAYSWGVRISKFMWVLPGAMSRAFSTGCGEGRMEDVSIEPLSDTESEEAVSSSLSAFPFFVLSLHRWIFSFV